MYIYSIHVLCTVTFLLGVSKAVEKTVCNDGDCADNSSDASTRYTNSGLNQLLGNNGATKLCVQEKPKLDKEPQEWQEVEGRKIKVFSAFYERREEADGPSIRIIGVGFQSAYNDIGDIHCILWYDNFDEGVWISKPAKYKVIYPSTMHPDMWVSHFIICPLPKAFDQTPYAVSVTSEPCDKPSNHLLVLNRDEVAKTETHALCVSPIYGNFKNFTMVIENFEIHKLLGASEITTYNLWTDSNTNKVLESYADDPDENVNIIQWPFPPKVKANVWGQRGALNDCLYRMGHKHKYVTITDMDEILVPRIVTTWPQLTKIMDAPARGIYMFQHAYFRRNITSKEEPYLITQQSLWRTDEVTPVGKIRCKSMYKAEKAISIDLHFHYKLVQGTEEYMVPPDEGMLHHYRKDPMETFRKYPERFTFIEDNHMRRFQNPLVEAVGQRLRKVGLE